MLFVFTMPAPNEIFKNVMSQWCIFEIFFSDTCSTLDDKPIKQMHAPTCSLISKM